MYTPRAVSVPTANVMLAFTDYYPNTTNDDDGCIQRYASDVERNKMGKISHVEVWLPAFGPGYSVDTVRGLWYSCTQAEDVRGKKYITDGDAKYQFFCAAIPVDQVYRMRIKADSMCRLPHDNDAMIAAGIRYWRPCIPAFSLLWLSRGACTSEEYGYFCSKFVHEILLESPDIASAIAATGKMPSSPMYTIPVHLHEMVESTNQLLWKPTLNLIGGQFDNVVNKFSMASNRPMDNYYMASDSKSSWQRLEMRREREKRLRSTQGLDVSGRVLTTMTTPAAVTAPMTKSIEMRDQSLISGMRYMFTSGMSPGDTDSVSNAGDSNAQVRNSRQSESIKPLFVHTPNVVQPLFTSTSTATDGTQFVYKPITESLRSSTLFTSPIQRNVALTSAPTSNSQNLSSGGRQTLLKPTFA